MKLEVGLYTGVMIGIRSFEPTEINPCWETHLYIPLLYIAFLSEPIE